MFREIRRIKNKISEEECKRLLKENKRGSFSVNGDDGYPFSIPINFYYCEEDNRIYFHSAKSGHKIDSINRDNKVCFTTWDDGYKVEGDWAYYVSCCVVFGKATLITDPDLTLKRIREFALKYYPTEEEVDEEIKQSIKNVQLVAINIEHISGKKIHEK
ncbi:MAG: pyridoxamine 5'-phosphate oxidase family protein [Lachnospiraceae bacterium]|nr:pyridoxamine 5'-phosphate oxidase family protein [Lachnospiraceae bacterium]